MGEEILQRANISWKDPEFLQEPQLEAQLRETFEICNTFLIAFSILGVFRFLLSDSKICIPIEDPSLEGLITHPLENSSDNLLKSISDLIVK